MEYKRFKIFIPLLFGISLASAYGQVQFPLEVKESLTSNVEYYASNYGIFGLDITNGKSGFISPRGSGKSYLFGSGLWFGAKKQVTHDGGATFNEEKLSFICYNPNSGASWAVPGEYNMSSAATPILYRSSDYNTTTGVSTSAPVSDPKWPLWLMPGEQTDPFFPGNFVPLAIDRTAGTTYTGPAFMSGVDEQFFARFHDQDLSRYELGESKAAELGYPLGLQIEQHVYSWNPGNSLQNVVILQYEVTNISGHELRDCYISQAIDFDIGNLANDHVMFYEAQPGLHTGIAWSETEAENYGLLAMVVLEGPVTDANGFIDNSNRSLFGSQGQVGVLRNWTIANDPRTPEERYNFMAAGVVDGDDGPGDKRALIGSKAFNMAPDDKAYFTIALAVLDGVTVNGTETKGPILQKTQIPELEALATELHNQYYVTGFIQNTSSAITGTQSVGAFLAAGLSPNPSYGNATLHLTLADRSDVRIKVIDNLGRTVLTENLPQTSAGYFQHNLNLEGIAPGSYLVSVEAGTEQQSIRLNVVR